jgi:RNA polymerase sigma-70 factor, ECF subfamily
LLATQRSTDEDAALRLGLSNQVAERRGRVLDRELVERAQMGDEAAYAVLALRIADRMYAAAHHILRDTGRAEDATQQAMIDIWRMLPQLKDPDRFQAWAYRIVVRAAYAEAKRQRLWGLRTASVADRRGFTPDPAGGIADRDQLERGFQRLPLDHRAVVVLKHFAGLSNDEIAVALDIPEGTVRSRLHYSLKTLRAALEADARTAGEAGLP